LNPCGRMVDYIRSAYTVDVRFFHDSPATTRTIQWSFVPEETPGMPWAHAFGSRTWDLGEEEEPLVGEVDGPRTWRGGTPPYPLPIVGQLKIDNLGICGTEEQWKNGASIMDPIPANWLNTAVPRCCKRPPLFARGGVAVGGPQENTVCCVGFTPPTILRLVFNNMTLCPVLNDVPITLLPSTFQPPGIWPELVCKWQSATVDLGAGVLVQWFLGCDPATGFHLVGWDTAGVASVPTQAQSAIATYCLPFRVDISMAWDWFPADCIGIFGTCTVTGVY